MLLYKDEEHSSQNEDRQRPSSAEHELKRNKTEKFKQQTKGDKYYGDYQKQTQQDERRMHQNCMDPRAKQNHEPPTFRQSSHHNFECNRHELAKHQGIEGERSFQYHRLRLGEPDRGNEKDTHFNRPPMTPHYPHPPPFELNRRHNEFREGSFFAYGAVPYHEIHVIHHEVFPRNKSHDRCIQHLDFHRRNGTMFDSDLRLGPHHPKRDQRRHFEERRDYKADIKDFYKERSYRDQNRDHYNPQISKKQKERQENKFTHEDEENENFHERRRQQNQYRQENYERHRYNEESRYPCQKYQECSYEEPRYERVPDEHLRREKIRHEHLRYDKHRKEDLKGSDHQEHQIKDHRYEEHTNDDQMNGAFIHERKRHERVRKDSREPQLHYKEHGKDVNRDNKHKKLNRKYYCPYELKRRGGGEIHHKHNNKYAKKATNNKERLVYSRYKVDGSNERMENTNNSQHHDPRQKNLRDERRKYFQFEERRDYQQDDDRVRHSKGNLNLRIHGENKCRV
ncbi:unnamed protein product [Moneuplotes crassus]|uniref:Uncharacterized protein n=1 Tax=Euplotes crassus TaxID=5936 RepID=A0AAD1UD73_EUPCR|nr:unnamed protein product [Moneuplotes crassus]